MSVAFLSNLFFDYLFSNFASRNVILKATSNNISCLKLFSKHFFYTLVLYYITDNKAATPLWNGMTALIAKTIILVLTV
ncbi:hypothetical protein DBL67_08570 [Paenibacillus polymyxa]|nr:hypothetical protein DBL67_08570 [Paenibacillus polymyxa]